MNRDGPSAAFSVLFSRRCSWHRTAERRASIRDRTETEDAIDNANTTYVVPLRRYVMVRKKAESDVASSGLGPQLDCCLQ